MGEEKRALSLQPAEAPPAWVPASTHEREEWSLIHVRARDYCWRTWFHVLGATYLLPRPMSISVQTTRNEHYHSEGRFRYHEKHCYFCYTLAGAGRFTDKTGDYRVASGQGFLMEIDDPGVQYCFSADEGQAWQFLAFEFDGLPSKSMVRGLTEKFGGCYSLAPQAPVLCRLLAYAPTAHRLSKDGEAGSAATQEIADITLAEGTELVMELLITLASAAAAAWETDREAVLVRKALKILFEDTTSGLRVSELAERSGVSREHLTRTFRRQLGRSPSQIIRERQMHYACVMLKQTETTVTEIAARLGYVDDTNFIHAFRQVTRMTPCEFRRHGSLSSWFHVSASNLSLLG